MTQQTELGQELVEGKALVAREVVKIYKGSLNPALNGLNISVNQGEIFGLLGPNGAGKTTAISIMSTLLRPTSGSITIYDIDVVRYPNEAKKFLSLVPQEIALYHNLTARENLRYFGRLYGLRGQQLENRIWESLELVGLKERGDERVFTFSGGMKRRANLAAGILNRPRLLFLDEPTVGIDAQSRNMILEKLVMLKNSGMAMIYTTHYMEEAELLCSSVVIIDKGQSIVAGNPQELIDQTPGCAGLQDLFFALTGKSIRD
jgi:ABC-2 type transport system ATP-binding protein